LCATLGAASIGITYFGRKLRTLGTWILIPSLYLACDFYDSAHPQGMISDYLVLLPRLSVALIGPLLILLIQYRFNRTDGLALWGIPHNIAGEREQGVLWSVGGIFVALFVTSFTVQLLGIEYGQWIIWSTVSVSTGQLASMHRKLGHRGWGALCGLLLGLAIVFLLPLHGPMDGFAAVLLPVTLVVRNYPIAFASRCMLIVIAAGSISQSEVAAEIRLIGVLAGGVIGVLCAYLSLGLASLSRKVQSS